MVKLPKLRNFHNSSKNKNYLITDSVHELMYNPIDKYARTLPFQYKRL